MKTMNYVTLKRADPPLPYSGTRNVTGTVYYVIHHKLHASVVKNVTGTVYYVIHHKLNMHPVAKDRQ